MTMPTLYVDGPYGGTAREDAVRERRERWHAEDPGRGALIDAIVRGAERVRFMRELLRQYDARGSLTAGQEASVRRILDERAAAQARRRDERRARHAGSAFVGEVGERRRFSLAVENVFTRATEFGTMHVHVMRDDDGNVVSYLGGVLGPFFERERGGFKVPVEPGSRIVVEATVKLHSEYDGTRQTVLRRPVLVEAPPPRVSELPFEEPLARDDDGVRFPTWGWLAKGGLHVRRPDGRILPWEKGGEGDALLLPTLVVERIQARRESGSAHARGLPPSATAVPVPPVALP